MITRKELKNKYNRLLEDPSQLQPWGDEMVDLIFDNKNKIDSYPSTEGLDPEKIYNLAWADGKLFWLEEQEEPPEIDFETHTILLDSKSELDLENNILELSEAFTLDLNQHAIIVVSEYEADLEDGYLKAGSEDEFENNTFVINSQNTSIDNHTLVIE